MPNAVKPYKIALVKEGLLKDKSYQEAMRDAGYGKGHSKRGKAEPVIKEALGQIQADFSSKITVDEVVDGLLKEAKEASKPADRISAWSWLGKHLAIFTDKTINDTKLSTKEPDQADIERMADCISKLRGITHNQMAYDGNWVADDRVLVRTRVRIDHNYMKSFILSNYFKLKSPRFHQEIEDVVLGTPPGINIVSINNPLPPQNFL